MSAARESANMRWWERRVFDVTLRGRAPLPLPPPVGQDITRGAHTHADGVQSAWKAVLNGPCSVRARDCAVGPLVAQCMGRVHKTRVFA